MRFTMKLKNWILSSLFAALIAVCSQISIPFSAIPINLGLLAVYISGSVLGWLYGGVSVLIYIALGAVGLPVFAGFKGGIGVLAGPTGGYILGYLFGAALCGALIQLRKDKFWLYPFAMVAACVICYSFGTLWYMVSTHTGLFASLAMCVLPYLPADVLKIAAASIVSYQLNRKIKKLI